MSTLIIIRSAPYGNTNAKDALDVLLTLGAFEQEPSLLLQGPGVTTLALGEQTSPFKHPGKMLKALPMYDVEHLYIDSQGAKDYNITAAQLDGLGMQVEYLDTQATQALMSKHQHIMVF